MKRPDFYCTQFIDCHNNLPKYQPQDCREQCNTCMDIIIDHHFNQKQKLSPAEEPQLKTYYAYASEELKTWFITPNKFCPIKNTRLLMILRCTASQEPLSIAGTHPAVDDVVSDYQNNAIKVVEAKLV